MGPTHTVNTRLWYSTPDENTRGLPVSEAHPLPTRLIGGEPGQGTPAQLVGGTKTVASSGTPERLSAVSLKCYELYLFPLRTNTGDVFIGVTSGNNEQHTPVPIVMTAPPGKEWDLYDFFVDVTVNGEGVGFILSQ